MEFHTASIDGIDYSDASADPSPLKADDSIMPEDIHTVEGWFQLSSTVSLEADNYQWLYFCFFLFLPLHLFDDDFLAACSVTYPD